MKKTAIAIFIIFLFSSLYAQRRMEGFGIGVIVGEPTGITIKTWTGNTTAIQAAAWSFSGYESFQFHADYLFHNFGILNSDEIRGALPLYAGIGGRIKLKEVNDLDGNDEASIGARVPLGMSYIFEDTPLDIFIEVVPILDLVPDTDFDLNGAAGIRFYL